MSGEYFSGPDVHDNAKFFEGYKPPPSRKQSGNKDVEIAENAKISQVHLEEMQKQLGKAETRCNTLKEQLDYMKKVCQNNNVDVTTKTKKLKNINKSSNESIPPEIKEEDFPGKEVALQTLRLFEKGLLPVRQNSQAIGTDKTGAAVKTINNILSGITESVNRLSELSAHMDERNSRPNSRRKSKTCGGEEQIMAVELQLKQNPAQDQTTIQELPEDKSQPTVLDEVTRDSSTILTHNSMQRKRPRQKRLSKSRVESSSASISLNNKKSIKSTAKHSEKRLKLNTVRNTMLESTSFTAPLRKRSFRRGRHWNGLPDKSKAFLERNFYTENLVELYHNKAVHQGSDSDESNQASKSEMKAAPKKKPALPRMSVTVPYPIAQPLMEQTANVPPLQIQEINEEFNVPPVKNELSPIQELEYDPPAAPRTVYSSCTKNYELPTIASKMKQAAKSYLRSFDFRAIPFCAARSTSPSHNIGINIQQVMNIIKTRQPISGISPTLAHNIGLAAEKLNSRPLSALVSSLGSRVTYGRSQCPLIRRQLNYQQLQEMAKEIPEEDLENCPLNEQASSNGAGDTERNNQGSVWTVDPSLQPTCTCYSQQGLGFQQVLNRYHSRMSTRTTAGSQLHYKISSSRCRLPKYLQRYTCPPRRKSRTPGDALSEDIPLQGRERGLKDVLKHLHDDFEHMNQKYDELSHRINEGGEPTEESVKELERMEKDLGHKEEEINMVMALYKEVLTLKEQVKILKEKASQASVQASMHPTIQPSMQPSMQSSMQPSMQVSVQGAIPLSHTRSSRYREIKDSNAALHLTKLLRQIQNYQETLKKEGRF